MPLGPTLLILSPRLLNQRVLVPLGTTLLILLPRIQFTQILGINPMGLSTPWAYSLDIIALRPVKRRLGITPMVLSDPRDDSFDIIALYTAEKNMSDQTSIYNGVNEVVTNRQNSDIKYPQNIYQLES